MTNLSGLFSRRALLRGLLFTLCFAALGLTVQAASPFKGTYTGTVVYNVKKFIANKKISDKTTTGTGKCVISAAGQFTLTGFHVTKAQHGPVSDKGTMGRTQVLVGNGKVKDGVVNYTGFVSSSGKNRTVQTWRFQNLTMAMAM